MMNMTKQKYFRKITIDRDKYCTVNLPKEISDYFLSRGSGYVEMLWDPESYVLILRAA
jgi:hypothetical protein